MPVHANSGSSNPGCDRRFPTHARNPGSRVAAMAPLPGSLCSGLLIPDTDLGENPRRERGV